MPLEDLLALYGYSDKDNPEADVPLDEIKPDPLPPLIDASEIDPPHPINPLLEETLLPENTDSPAPPDSPLSVPSPGSPQSPPSPRGSRDNNFFPENQRITRGCEYKGFLTSFSLLILVQNTMYLVVMVMYLYSAVQKFAYSYSTKPPIYKHGTSI